MEFAEVVKMYCSEQIRRRVAKEWDELKGEKESENIS